MKPDTREAPGASGGFDPLAVEPDNDLDLPTIELTEPLNLGSLAPAPSEFAAAPVQSPSRRVALRAPVAGRGLYLAALIATVLWAALALYAAGYQWPVGAVEFQPYQLAAMAILAVAPIGFFWITAYCLSQGARLAAEVMRSRTAAQNMLEPAALALAETGQAVEGVRLEIQAATAAAANARAELLSLRKALAEETEKLAEATAKSASAAHTLNQSLGREREEMAVLAASLDTRSLAVSEAVARQARMVAEASDLAQTQIGEAEAALAARAADLAAAAGDAGQAGRLASEDLARQIARLETATIGVSDQIRSMEDTLTGQRAALVSVAHTVRADHEDFAAKIETQRAQLNEILANAQLGAIDLNAAAASAGESIGQLAESATAQATELAQTAKAERDLLAASALQSLGAVSEAARYERESLEADIDHSLQAIAGAAAREGGALHEGVRSRLAELSRLASAEGEALKADALESLNTMTEAAQAAVRTAEGFHGEARKKMEALSEVAYDAAQQAENAFQARLKDATDLINRSASLVDEAAVKTAERIERATGSAQVVLGELEATINDFQARVDKLPGQTQAQAEELRAAVSNGFNSLLTSARAAAEETQAIDAAFQERVRRNYEMLSEAVRLMGVVSGRPATAPPTARPTPPLGSALDDPPAGDPAPAAPRPRFSFAARATPSPLPPSSAGLRPRLKLSPTAADTQVSNLFGGVAEPAAGAGVGWTWQELLSSMDDTPVNDSQLADRLVGEIEGLGVDMAALLPAGRIEEIAAVMGAGDAEGVRSVIRHLAPAALRRVSRRVLSEKALKVHAERYVGRYWAAIDQALDDRGRHGPTVADILSSEEGRTFLLFDAALGDAP